VGNEGAWVESDAVEVSDTVTKYYTFNGQRVAMRRGDVVNTVRITNNPLVI
jgi:hypothetical protein